MASELNKAVGGSIDPAQAKKWIANYQKSNPKGIFAHFFGSDIIEAILAQDGCVGIRMYYALDDKNVQQLILVGSKEDGSNIWPSDIGKSFADGIVADDSWTCPSLCAPN